MSSVDVIELGSSDEETEPAPKKKKPSPNIMVKIPPNLSELTITPTIKSPKINPVSFGKSVTVTKVPQSTIITNPYANKNKLNGNTIKIQPMARHTNAKHVSIPINKQVKNACVNPQLIPIVGKHLIQNQTRPLKKMNTTVNPLNPMSLLNVVKPGMTHIGKGSNIVGKSIVQPMSKFLPGVTITKTSGAKKPAVPKNNRRNPLVKRPKQLVSNEVLTVDLDDDEPQPSSASGPQWYMRPEDQNKSTESEEQTEKSSEKATETVTDNTSKESPEGKTIESQDESPETEKQPEDGADLSSLEKENNKEPVKTNFIEITIEDSPVKPITSKKGFKVGAELAITIDDSPIKHTIEKTPPGSDEEQIEKVKEKKNSKKKLKYPKEVEQNVIEIEIEPFQPEVIPKETVKAVKPTEITRIVSDVIEIEESPIKTVEREQVTPKKSKAQPVKIAEFKHLDDNEKNEFHSTYQAFIELCFELENSDDMKKIVEKKIKSYYRQVPKDYTESEMFVEMVLSKTIAMKAAPEKMYLYIKDIVDDLDVQRKLVKKQAEEKKEEQDNFLYGEKSEFDTKRQRQIRKLEKTLKKLHRAIQKLEEQEVDFDDDEDSVYLLTERYKERMVRVHAKLCQLTNTKMPSEPRIQIDARPGQPKGPAKRLEKWVNKKVPIGTPLPFPDFHDVLKCVRDANQQDKLGWNEADIMEEARDLFTRCGRKLQRRRQENEWRLAASRIQTDGDPAENSDDLKKKLEDNKRVAAKRETEILNKYADRQKQLKLEAEEIGDKEAEESPEESEEEEIEDKGSLENKQGRKERLKRLLQEKSRKSIDKLEQFEDTSKQDEQHSKEDDADAVINDKKHDLSNETECPPSKRAKIVDDSVGLEASDKDKPKDQANENTGDCEENKGGESDKCDGKSDKIHSLSDDSSKLESDVDELHLLQKLHSENECNSSALESDSDSPIAISDESLSSDLGENMNQSSDVISIENSSYSESEEKKDEGQVSRGLLVIEEIREADDSNASNEISKDTELELNNCENIESEETRLLADDINEPADKSPNKLASGTETCGNLKDDNISLDETEVGVIPDSSPDDANKQEDTEMTDLNALDTETCANLRDDNISITETEIGVIQDCLSDDSGNKEDNRITNADIEACVNLRDDNSSIDEVEISDAHNSPSDKAKERAVEEMTNILSSDNLGNDSISIDSSPDDAKVDHEVNLNTETCTNLKDDNISIEETEITYNHSPDDNKEVGEEVLNEVNLEIETSKNVRESIFEDEKADESGIPSSTDDTNTICKPKQVNLDKKTCAESNKDDNSISTKAIEDSNSSKDQSTLDCNKNGNTDSETLERMDVCTENESKTTELDKARTEVTSSSDNKEETSIKRVETDSSETLKSEENITKERDKNNSMDTAEKTDIVNHEMDKSPEKMEVDLNGT